MNPMQIKDAEKCEQMLENGEEMDCMGCSCNVCLAQVLAKNYEPVAKAAMPLYWALGKKDAEEAISILCEELKKLFTRQELEIARDEFLKNKKTSQ